MGVVDLSKVRAQREVPDDEFVRHDENGCPVFCFIGQYRMGTELRRVDIWAYDMDEAKRCAAAMGNVVVAGQVFSAVRA